MVCLWDKSVITITFIVYISIFNVFILHTQILAPEKRYLLGCLQTQEVRYKHGFQAWGRLRFFLWRVRYVYYIINGVICNRRPLRQRGGYEDDDFYKISNIDLIFATSSSSWEQNVQHFSSLSLKRININRICFALIKLRFWFDINAIFLLQKSTLRRLLQFL